MPVLLRTFPASRPRPRAAAGRWLPALLAALALLPAPVARAASRSAPGPAWAADWQSLLDQYCFPLSKSADGDTRFDYEQLYVDEHIWRLHSSERLRRIHDEMFSVKPAEMAPNERLAWAINAYNFLVVEEITLHLLVPNRLFTRFSTVDQIRAGEGGFYDATSARLDSVDYSLHRFERVFVYGDSTPTLSPRKRAGDPRLMFALCRGTVGGPPLAREAYRADDLDRQLDRATRTALALPRFLNYTPGSAQLEVATLVHDSILDFGGTEKDELDFFARYGPSAVRGALHGGRVKAVGRYLPYDLTLNQIIRPKTRVPQPGADSKS